MPTDSMGRGWADVLAEIPLFAGLSKRQLNKIAKLAKTRRYARFTPIVRAGDRGDSFYVILDGTALVKPPGKRGVRLGAGDWFGEMALLQASGKRTATVTADTDLTCVGMTSWAFKSFLAGHPDAAWQVIETMAQREAATRE